MKKIIVILFVIAVLSGISYFLSGINSHNHNVGFIFPGSKRNITIHIQPFDDLPRQQAAHVFEEVKKIYANTILLEPIKLPVSSYYEPRNRYRADTIIQWLSDNTQKNTVTIGLTSKDISTNKDNIKDWGVMGLGFQPGNACIVSTFRLSRGNLTAQLFKVCVHELGHTQGLAHCDTKSCFMRDAEGHNSTDEEYEFCPKCKKILESKGWVFLN